jgi:peptidoglycan/LPS O-acetylase OafA/YrhL
MNIAVETQKKHQVSHITVLDGLRGVAALMIIIFHYDFQQLGAIWEKLTTFGQTGVDLFFVLSGFLITRILLSTRDNQHYFKNFYMRRALRIFPLYYGFLVLTYFVLPFLEGSSPPPFTQQIWYWLYLQNIPTAFNIAQASGPGHFWSLAVEEHFYLLWPIAIYCLSNRKILVVSTLMIIGSFLMRLVLLSYDISVFSFTLCRMDALVLGALLALLELQKEGLHRYRRFFLTSSLISIALLSVVYLQVSGQGLDYIQAIKFPIIALFYTAAIGYLVGEQHSNLTHILNLRFLRFSGSISYGLYVFHPLCFHWAESIPTDSFWSRFVGSLALSYIVAYLSYRIYEKPFLRFKKYFTHSSCSSEST